MTHVTVVRYRTHPERAEDNVRLLGDVFAELAEHNPEGLRYAAFRLEDEVSFVHVAALDGDDNPLMGLATFREFLSGIQDRCTDPPAPANATVIGSYRLPTG